MRKVVRHYIDASFAVDTNGRKMFSITFQYNVLKNNVNDLINNIANWLNVWFLKVNPEKKTSTDVS